jgi:predicted nucleic acid-binding protein
VTFLDTGFLFALVSERDAHHGRVVEVFNTFKGLRLADYLLTTNHVIAETITLTLKIGHGKAVALGEQLYAEKLARIHWATPDEERAAFAYFKRHQDQTYSCVDCLSFVDHSAGSCPRERVDRSGDRDVDSTDDAAGISLLPTAWPPLLTVGHSSIDRRRPIPRNLAARISCGVQLVALVGIAPRLPRQQTRATLRRCRHSTALCPSHCGHEHHCKEAFERAVREISTVRDVRFGKRVTRGAGYEASAPDTADYSVTIDFDDLAGLQAYLRHPAHEKLGARFGESISSGLVYDFEAGGLVDDLISRSA